MNELKLQKEKLSLTIATLVFIAWSAIFIYRTSFIAIDGNRYFCLFDDAMISMRYAWNFSHGNGLVWNAGENVQGYTNLLMTLLMSFATLVFDKSIAALFIQILGIGFMLTIAITSLKIADHLSTENGDSSSQRAAIRTVAFILALAYYPLTYWSLMGMETGLLTALLSLGVLLAYRYTENGRPVELFLASIFLGLAFLTRNDSIIFAILIWMYIHWEAHRRKPHSKAFLQIYLVIALYLLFILGQSLFQYVYYGEVLPNTYVLKLIGWPLFARISNGLGYIFPFFIQISFLLIPVIWDIFIRPQKEKLLLLSIVLSAIGYQVYIGGDPWNYWRMVAPTIPLLGILFIFAICSFMNSGTKNKIREMNQTRNSAFQVYLLVLTGMLVANAYFLPETLFLEKPFYVSANQRNTNLAIALSDVTHGGASVGIFWAGALPYYAERKSLDFLGKSDRYIAHLPPDLSGKLAVLGMKSLPGHNKYDLNYSIKQLQPTYIQDAVWGGQDLSAWAQTRYVQVEYKGMNLLFLRDSTDVAWEKVKIP